MIQILGLFLGIGILIYFAYRGISALPLTLVAGLAVIITNRMDIWQSFSEFYMKGYVGFLNSYFFIFAASALYAKIMEDSGAAISIGYKFIDWFGKKRAVLIVFLATAVLTYGGISVFVVIFAITPIIMLLFKEANLPRRLAMGPLLAGAATFTMTTLPGSPQLPNVIPTRFLGTTMVAAPVMSIIGALIMFFSCYFYLKWEEKRLVANGETFSYPLGVDPTIYEVNRHELPPAFLSFIPMIALIAVIVGMKSFITNSTELVVIAMLIASGLALILNWGRIKNKKETINKGLGGAILAIASPCAVVAFGTLVQNTPAFQSIISWLLDIHLNSYIMGPLATAIISGITGSSSGGLTITLQTLSDQIMASGGNMSIVHRLMAIAAGSLDTLPHSSGLFLMFGILGLTHKESYRFVFVTTVIIPALVCILLVVSAIAFGL
ncbi:GntP family permease [Fusibacter bizertensis]